jgi:hypothetical protein
MAMTEKYLARLRATVTADMDMIRKAGLSTEPLGTLLFNIANAEFVYIVTCGESMYDRFIGLDTKGQGVIGALRRFVMGCCEAIYYRKTRDCGFFVKGIRYSDNPKEIVTWEELLSEFAWGKNPEFVYKIERIHKT